MLNGTTFLGWVSRGHGKDALERRLEQEERVTRRILRVEDFEWKNAGGRYSRGDVSIP